MTRKRLRVILRKDDPWLDIRRSHGKPPQEDDTWTYVFWWIVAVAVLVWLLA